MDDLFTASFWRQAAERAIKAACAYIVGAIGSGAIFTKVDWRVVFGGAVMASITSICMSVASSGAGPVKGSPSLVDVPCTPK
jgi:hypothetical protein